jgi:hypothetical protein
MSNISERGISKQIDNTQILLDKVRLMTNYEAIDPSMELNIIQIDITTTFQANEAEATAKQYYLSATAARTSLFKGSPNSILGIATLINAAVESRYEKKSQEMKVTAAFVRKLRGTKLGAASNISQAQTSYGSIVGTFSDIIKTLSSFTPIFDPINPLISIPALKNLRDNAMEASSKVNTTLAQYQTALATRNEKIADLHEKAMRLKNVIKEIYGTNSPEYKQIKGLKV